MLSLYNVNLSYSKNVMVRPQLQILTAILQMHVSRLFYMLLAFLQIISFWDHVDRELFEQEWTISDETRAKILLADLSSISDTACHAYIESQRAKILSKGPPSNQYGGQPSNQPSNQYEGHNESSRSQYRESQYRESQYRESQYQGATQGEQVQGDHIQGEQLQSENQISPSDQQDYTPYYHYLSGNDNPSY